MSDEGRHKTIHHDDDEDSSSLRRGCCGPSQPEQPGFSDSSYDNNDSSNDDTTLLKSSLLLDLPDLPDGSSDSVIWKQNPTNPKEWTLLRIDQQHENDLYKLEPAVAWNPNTGREQMIVKPVLKKKRGDDDTSTVATSMSDVDIGDNNIDDDDDDYDQELKDFNNNSNCATIKEDDDEDAPKESPVLGRDYIIHTIIPSLDTFSGLLLRYKIKAVTLRRINQFSGTNLSLAPSQLVIPLLTSTDLANIKIQDVTSKEYKLQILLIDYPHLNINERKAYLNMNDWNLKLTKKHIEDDQNWEKEEEINNNKQKKNKS